MKSRDFFAIYRAKKLFTSFCTKCLLCASGADDDSNKKLIFAGTNSRRKKYDDLERKSLLDAKAA